jgi:transposase
MIGRPAIDPDLMLRMLIVGYCMGIRSKRRLCDEVHLNLASRSKMTQLRHCPFSSAGWSRYCTPC